jgi:hypothetical protein
MSKKTKTLLMYEDPGHAWCKVRRDDKIFQMIAKDVTYFSYQNGKSVYLEEDCDLGLYYNKLVELGYQIKWKYKPDNESRIREYAPYKYTEVSPVTKKQYDITKSSAVVYVISENEYKIGYAYTFRSINRVMKNLDKKFYNLRDKNNKISTLSKSFPLNKPDSWCCHVFNDETQARMKKEIQSHVEKVF